MQIDTGKFITIEGTDGVGKTTQINLLIHFLEEKGHQVIFTREPGGTAIGEKIRNILLDAENKEMTNITEALLYAAGRAQHVAEKIIPALKLGAVVICDRFTDSSLAYQGTARGCGQDFIEKLNEIATGGLLPDLTLYFELDPALGILRKKKEDYHKLDRIELEKLEFHKKVYEGYQILLKNNSKRIKVIQADRSIEEVHSQVRKEINNLLGT